MKLNSKSLTRLMSTISPQMILQDALGAKTTTPWNNDVLEFMESDRFCGMDLYPNQRLMFKLWSLQVDDLTDFEKQTIDEWSKSFQNLTYTTGISTDIYERVHYLKTNGYDHFPTVILILGRRASKSKLSGAYIAYQDANLLWNGIPSVSGMDLEGLGEEQDSIVGDGFFVEDGFDEKMDFSGISKDTSVYSIFMATTANQAQESIFSDYYNTVLSCKWMQPYILRATPFQVVYQTVNDKLMTIEYLQKGMPLESEFASVVARPISSNSNSIRGRAIMNFVFDEVFFSQGGESARSGERSIKAILPATQQFGRNRCTIYPSSPWTREGYVYRMYLQGRNLLDSYIEKQGKPVNQRTKDEAIDEIDKAGEQLVKDPTIFIAQLESWRLYDSYRDQSFRPTYYPGFSPKKLVLVNQDGDKKVVEANTNARVGQYVSINDGGDDK